MEDEVSYGECNETDFGGCRIVNVGSVIIGGLIKTRDSRSYRALKGRSTVV